MRRALLLGSVALALLALGCGPQFDPSNELKALRVLGVKKDHPYAQPGQDVKLQLLWHDPQGRSDIQRVWIGGCINPPGDLYYGCFLQFGQVAEQGGVLPLGVGDSFSVAIPTDIISSRGGPFEPGQPRYGLYIVFFALCAGQLDIAMEADLQAEGSTGLPIRCLDNETDEPLGSEDFIVGYSSIYSFEGVQNQNPTFSVDDQGNGEFLIAGRPAPADCVGEECQTTAAVEVDCSVDGETRCIDACEDDGDGSCPAIEVAPAIEQIVEPDDVTSLIYGSKVDEQMWVNYYLDRGAINEVRLLNDSATGWNEKYRGQLRAPKDPGPLQLWAVAHDNRGGMEWSRVTLQVK
jgi:hypothetical protein